MSRLKHTVVQKACARVAGSVFCAGALALARLHAGSTNQGMDGLNGGLELSQEAVQAVTDGKFEAGRDLAAEAFEKAARVAENTLPVNSQRGEGPSVATQGLKEADPSRIVVGPEIPPPSPKASKKRTQSAASRKDDPDKYGEAGMVIGFFAGMLGTGAGLGYLIAASGTHPAAAAVVGVFTTLVPGWYVGALTAGLGALVGLGIDAMREIF